MDNTGNTIVIDPELFGITMNEIKEYLKLKNKIYGKKTSLTQKLFVILDENNADHQRYINLNKAMVKIYAFTFAHRNELDLNENWLQTIL